MAANGATPDRDIKEDVAKFDGSFAPKARPTEPLSGPWYTNRDYLIGGWSDPSIWKAAFIEAVGTSGLVYVSGNISTTLLSYDTKQVGAYIGLSNVFLISIFIYATAATTGGHLNQMITFSAIFSGICPISRGTLYICGQTLGAAVHGGGCFYNTTTLSSGEVFLNEVFASLVLLFLSYGVGLDPRQAVVFGPRLGPLLVGSSLGILSFATSGVAPGYAGAQMNPARCFAFGVARRDMSGQWIWWFGPAIAALLQALIYSLAPPAPRPKAKKDSLPALPVMHPCDKSRCV
ncbi:aquaporin-like protein [Aspergillus pseudocaelatus]|uniref:Aquaporin-like protein n=1 Tax=Aspergillus pseudocaelatus TaxID=1825620 RepID=A0ABQ6WSH0_9EURO|nr:aquaporin-like protein [Aspergillus pseudocaelatus]